MALPKADTVLKNGRVFESLESGFREAVALWCGRVLATGDWREIEALVGPDTRVIDLRGRAVVPGFNDAHQHLMSLGLTMEEIDLRPRHVKSLESLLDRVRARVAGARPGDWIFGGRYDHFHLDIKRHPHREELDSVAPDNPVFLKRTCGHMGVANSRALRLAGIAEDSPDPPGGHIERQNGRLTGLLQERAQELISAVVPPLSQEALIAGIERAGRHMLSRGVTSVMDAAVGMRQGMDDYLAYQEARRQGRLPVRTYLSLTGGPAGIQDRALERGLKTGVGDDYLRVGSVKLFTDGSAGGKTAAMRDPYRCTCASVGILIYDDRELNHWVDRYHRAGLQISLHAIGDAAIDQVIGAVDKAMEKTPATDRRHRIEHCGFTSPDQIASMRRLGMYPAPQPIFLYEFGDLYVDVLGEARPGASYPMRAWFDAGLHPAASSDAPVSDTSTMANLYTMVTRKTDSGRVLGADQALGLAEAVSALTYNGAYVSFAEGVKGTLRPGRLADLAVLERDIFALEPDALLETEVDLTVRDGQVVYDRTGEASA